MGGPHFSEEKGRGMDCGGVRLGRGLGGSEGEGETVISLKKINE